MGMLPGGARIFVIVRDNQGVIITEIYYAEELNDAFPGYDLIASSFRLKP